MKAAIAEFPDHSGGRLRRGSGSRSPAGTSGTTCASSGAYVEVLRRETEEVLRATPTLNLAETQMHLGELKEAIEGYREALRIASAHAELGARPRRSPRGASRSRSIARAIAWPAEREARFALELERSMGYARLLLRSKDVFFVPAYELHWYEGLGCARARARVAAVARAMRPRSGVTAERSFAEYVRKAGEPKNDRWLAIAKARLAQSQSSSTLVRTRRAPREP